MKNLKDLFFDGLGKMDIRGERFGFPSPIRHVVIFKEKIFVLIYGDAPPSNVFAFDLSGSMLWAIKECPHGDKGKPYVDLIVDKDKLIACASIGVDYEVDIDSGEVKPYGSGKRPW